MRTTPILPNYYYHIYNRGVNYGNIFFKPANWRFFLVRLRHYLTPDKGKVIAYCLMPNHFHFLLHVLCDDFGNSVMQPFLTSFTKAINQQENRVGPLFQGPYQAKLIEKDIYLLHLSRYIHLNPVVAGLVRKPEDWEYSSHQDYVGLRGGTLPVTDIILSQFLPAGPALGEVARLRDARNAYAEFVTGGIEKSVSLSVEILFD